MAISTITRRKTATKTLTVLAVEREVSRRSKPKAERGKASSWAFSMLDNTALAAVLDGKVVKAVASNGNVHFIGTR